MEMQAGQGAPDTYRFRLEDLTKMKCARLKLQERCKSKTKPEKCYDADKPLRYCQKRMINPKHEEDPRWADIFERFHCNYDEHNASDTTDSGPDYNSENLFLSVQTLQFRGNVELQKRSRNNFKFRSPRDGAQHRMFVKQQVIRVDDEYGEDDGRSSQLTCYYFDDYVKYLFTNDKSRPDSGKSSIFLQSLRSKKVNKETQVDVQTGEGCKKTRKVEVKGLLKKCAEQDIKDEIKSDDAYRNSKISFHQSGLRKSLTISRAQSPETVQVIRVDVVRNQSRGSVMSTNEYEDKTLERNDTSEFLTNFDIKNINVKNSHFANKYLLTNTIKPLDENLCGEKVTLLCKTFKLSERSRSTLLHKPKTNPEAKSYTKSLKNGSSTEGQLLY